MEIEVGEYVRTKTGKIRKVKDTVAQYYITDRLNILDNNQFVKEDIVKHSKNIIDLIEVGDYVNGQEIIEIRKQNGKIYLMTSYVPQSYINYKIEEILTKEQYEINCYKVGE